MGWGMLGGWRQKKEDAEITLEVNDIDHILKAPERDPYSRNPLEYMGQSAIERCLIQVRKDRHWNRKRYRIVFLIPPDQVGVRDVIDIKLAIDRFCATQIDDNISQLHVIRRKGIMQLPFAFAILFIAVTSGVIIGSDFFVEMSPLVATAVSEGLYVIGWVALWGPTDTLLFEPIELKKENMVLKAMEDVEIELRSKKTT
jgi:hypothetical protein